MKPTPILVYEWLVPLSLVVAVVYELLARRVPQRIEMPVLLGFIGFGLALVLVYPEARDTAPSTSDIAILGLLASLAAIRWTRSKRNRDGSTQDRVV